MIFEALTNCNKLHSVLPRAMQMQAKLHPSYTFESGAGNSLNYAPSKLVWKDAAEMAPSAPSLTDGGTAVNDRNTVPINVRLCMRVCTAFDCRSVTAAVVGAHLEPRD